MRKVLQTCCKKATKNAKNLEFENENTL